MDLDTPIDLSDEGGIDPFDFVYSNLPEMHILEKVPDCEHCHAKKFEHETPGFYYRNRHIELAEPTPMPELMRLWSSADVDNRYF